MLTAATSSSSRVSVLQAVPTCSSQQNAWIHSGRARRHHPDMLTTAEVTALLAAAVSLSRASARALTTSGCRRRRERRSQCPYSTTCTASPVPWPMYHPTQKQRHSVSQLSANSVRRDERYSSTKTRRHTTTHRFVSNTNQDASPLHQQASISRTHCITTFKRLAGGIEVASCCGSIACSQQRRCAAASGWRLWRSCCCGRLSSSTGF